MASTSDGAYLSFVIWHGAAAISCDSPSLTLRVGTADSILTRSVSEGRTTFYCRVHFLMI
jgi:hypothetical protein